SLRVTKVGVVGGISARSLDRVGGSVGHILRGHLRVFHAHPLHFIGVRGVAVLAGLLLAAIILAFVFFLGVVAAVLAHFESVQQVVDDVAVLALILNQALEPIEIAARRLFAERAP